MSATEWCGPSEDSLLFDIARHVGTAQQGTDLVGLVEGAVELEADFGRAAQARLLAYPGAEPGRRAPQGRAVRVTDAGRRGLRTEFGVEAG